MEIWKSIKGYSNYQVSNYGNVKSLKTRTEVFLKPGIGTGGYLNVGFFINGKTVRIPIHKLVAVYFLNHKIGGYKLVVNHIDFNRTNNNVNNLEIITSRENTNKKHLKSSSQYNGVHWHVRNKKWMSRIKINNKEKHLGCFKSEYDAHLAYEKALKEIH